MPVTKTEVLPIRSGDDVVRVRQQVRMRATEIGLSLVDQTKIVTAASELARNALDYGGGGEVRIDLVQEGGHRGVRLCFEAGGPAKPHIDTPLPHHNTTGGGLGLGLGGAKRLSNEFHIDSTLGAGTRVTIARWK